MAGSLSSILSIARSALLSHQKSVSVASHNVANASTEGYSRQRAHLEPGPVLVTPQGGFGTGVHVVDVQRLRDTLLDANFRDQSSLHAGFEQRLTTLSEIEDVLAEPSPTGLAAALDAFWAAWGDLANNPINSTARLAVRDRANALIDAFRRIDGGLARAERDTVARLSGMTGRLNEVSARIADLNRQIAAAEAGGQTAGDLRDQRDGATDRLAELIPVHVVERGDGQTGVYAAGLALVDGAYAKSLTVTTGSSYALAISGGGPSISTAGAGRVGAALDLLNGDLPAYRQRLDDLAAGLAGAVNAVHQTGTNAAGNTGIDVFDPAGLSARTLALSAAVTADAGAIAAGTPDGAGLYQAGANDVALAMAQLRDAPQAALGGVSFGAHYGDFTTDLGLAVSSAEGSARAHEAIRHQADVRRSEVSGVSIDEEMIDLMRFQQAFAAASRLVTVADEMIQSVLRMV